MFKIAYVFHVLVDNKNDSLLTEKTKMCVTKWNVGAYIFLIAEKHCFCVVFFNKKYVFLMSYLLVYIIVNQHVVCKIQQSYFVYDK